MPEIYNPDNTIKCGHCGQPARYVSINTKTYRCTYRVTSCRGMVGKMKKNRPVDYNHMKKMSTLGHLTLASKQENDKEWLENKKKKISDKVKERGGHQGKNNPRYGQLVTAETRNKMSESALKSNHPRGQYERTDEHRDNLSNLMILRHQNGTIKKIVRNTKPEIKTQQILSSLGAEWISQYLIQYGSINQGKRFRHCYDLYVPKSNLLIEVDGDYWHSLKNIITRDIECESVAKDRGFRLIRILQSDLDNHPFEVALRINREL